MPEVTRLAGDPQEFPDGFAVTTEAAGDTYRYEFRRSNDGDAVELVERTKNGDPVEHKTTYAVVRALEDRGVEVV